jgi:hypothetical protein
MQHTGAMRGIERARDLARDLDGGIDRELAAALEAAEQALAVEHLHRDVRAHAIVGVDGAALVDRDDTGMANLRGRAALLKEAREHVGIRQMRLVQDLQRDVALEVTVVSRINLRERARAELLVELVATEAR